MADGFGVAMAEMEFAGLKFKGGKIFVVLTALTTLGGGLWGGFEFYKDYLNMKEQIQNNNIAQYYLFAGSEGLINEMIDSQWLTDLD